MLKVSHTAKELFKLSPRAWFLHYKLYLREEKLSSALAFGQAIDAGLDHLLLTRDLPGATEAFVTHWNKFKGDTSIRFGKTETNDSDGKPWEASLEKGPLLLAQYHAQILPKIKRVLATQVNIEIVNDAGEVITGKADFICEWEDGRILLLDNKTTSVKYDDDKISNSSEGMQLALYEEGLNGTYPLDGVGFIVIDKKVRKKKEPRVVITEHIGNVSEEMKQKTLEEFSDMVKKIKLGNFPCHSPNCDTVFQQCCYKRFCESNGEDLTGLKYLQKEKK